MQKTKIFKFDQVRLVITVTTQVLMTFVLLLVVANQYSLLSSLDSYFRTTVPTLCLGFTFILTMVNARAGFVSCIFALPLIPNFSFELQAFTGYGRLAQSHNPGMDLVSGYCLAMLLRGFKLKNCHKTIFITPPPVYLTLIYLTASTTLAISRNLHQSQSAFNSISLINNLLSLRTIGWHDDYKPLFDLIVFALAASFVALSTRLLSTSKNRNHLVFIPLIAGLLISVVVGLFQSQKGIGLQWFHFFFRVDRLGYVALGLQPDIHAFAGYMLIGALGLFGYVYSLQNQTARLTILLLIVPVSWVGLILSKSKSTLALALFFLLVVGIVWACRHSKHLSRAIIGFLIFASLLVIAGFTFRDISTAYLTNLVHKLGIKDLTELNLRLVYRPEIFIAAIRMFLMFPILGMGQSEFYRQSANHQLTQSYFLSIEQNGENAHNYFLQTLAETGIVGFGLFSLVVLYPIYKIKNKRLLIPAIVGLGSIFISNLYAHSLLVRENLFIAAAFLSLMYAWCETEKTTTSSNNIKANSSQGAAPKLIGNKLLVVLFIITITLLAAKEVKQAFQRFPFTFDTQCYKTRPIDKDGWTSGLYEVAMPPGSNSMTFILKGTQPDVTQRALPVQLSIVHGEKDVVVLKDIILTTVGPLNLTIEMPEKSVTKDDNYRAVLNLGRCFIPKNMGINADDRRLGVQVQSVVSK